ncbi:hypothetical protein A5757_05615 [Mycobacterium sp. 852013-51886_SCH5428379]|nr:hypothetical protein [Mycobacterium sp. 852013-51886_SCH5428379]MCK0172752.1 hypothetical protein [Mycolicibacterium sp. F2034L]OBB61863.1 hypothetical protein A5757_05615 [Mycobacterium sp. 852013-51886_SCH5428379]
MRIRARSLGPLSVAVGVAALLSAPVATATPNCVNTSPTTTVCETGGSTQIVTSPPPMNYGNFGFPFYGYGLGGLFIGI